MSATLLRARLAKLIPLLGSPQEGERSAAIEAIARTLASANTDWHYLAGLVGGSAVVPDDVANRDSPGDEHLLDTLLRLGAEGRLTDAQSRFVRGCSDQWTRSGWLSQKQREVLVQIRDDARSKWRGRRRA